MGSGLLARIPDEDIAARRKVRAGGFPAPQRLVSLALLIVDMVAAVVRDEYPNRLGAAGQSCATAIAGIRGAAKVHDIPVIYTVTPTTNAPVLIGQRGRGESWRAVPPFSLEPEAHEIVPEPAPNCDDIVLAKAKPSAFYGTQLSGILNALGTRSLIVTGMTTSGCIRGSLLDAFNLNYAPVVPIEGVADRASLSHEVNLFDIGGKYGDVVTTASLVEAMNELRNGPAS